MTAASDAGTRTPVVAAKVRVPPAAALPRERLQALLDTVWERRLGLVVAPAGSGKTTLLADFAARAGVPVAWYRTESWDADERSMVRHLEAALLAALPDVRGGWGTVEDAAAALDERPAERALLVVDDAHGLEGTPAESALGRFVEYAPAWLAIVIGSRLAPSINLTRLRVAGDLVEIGPDELRFRAWEVERLFRDHYGEPVPPDELAVLARRTEGWAAGLQLFHLATRGKSPDERRRILAAVGAGSRLIREYLTWNVMADLPEELRDFLVETCVLGRLTGPLCDRLLERRGSAGLLAELYRRQIFTVELDEADESYRYHEVFRSLLDRMLVDRVGEDAARGRYTRAGELLEAAGAIPEALGAYSRAEDWEAVRRLLGGQGERIASYAPAWLESLPPAIVRHEPWLELASARRARAEGRWSDALDAFGRAEAGFGASTIALVCHRERQLLRAWFEPSPPGTPADWSRILRAGVVREPLAAAREAASQDGVPPSLLRGLLALAAGDVIAARAEFAAARSRLDGEPMLAAACGLGLGVAGVLAGDAAAAIEIDAAEDAAEQARAPWLGWLARAASRLADDAAAPVDPAWRSSVDGARDPWGAALAALIEAWEPGIDPTADRPTRTNGATPSPGTAAERRVAAAERAAAEFRRLGAGVLEAWARGLVALGLAESSAPEAREAAMTAESLARAAGAPGARLLTYRAMRLVDEARGADYEALEATVTAEMGLVGPPPADRSSANRRVGVGPTVNGAADAPMLNGHSPSTVEGALRVRTLGGFAVIVEGRDLALDGIKPRARSLLRLLAVHAGSAVHREVLAAALWPEADAPTAGRSLQVAVSAVRGLFADALGGDGGRFVVRDGDAYRLGIDPEAVDVRRFDRAVADARQVRSRGGDIAGALSSALALYGGDLLPEEGPSEWVVELREHYRSTAVDVAREAAEAAGLAGDARGAIDACRAGLAIDRYHDPLWRLLIQARQAAGDVSAANRDRREYEAILIELGVPEAPAFTSS
ncbi:MAG TPA: BTAD domain-containing putative transcriptional regulator [Candidatus Limnocylindrales bacterium]|nr:BTAD domain-containing putative transcriptional regulator [Candidatus Limnocylindrales bacterium]